MQKYTKKINGKEKGEKNEKKNSTDTVFCKHLIDNQDDMCNCFFLYF